MAFTRNVCITFVAVLGFAAGSQNAFAAAAVDCEKVMTGERNDTITINPNDITTCMHRGWDPPVKWRPKDGKGAGTRVGGAAGFSYGAVQAPENPPGRQGANASISRAAITAGCNFPPRLRIGSGGVSIASGSCLDFLNDVFKDNSGAVNSSPPPVGVPEDASCPAESDTTGVYGVKAPISGGSVTAPCGGVVPTTSTDLTLNANPTHFAAVSGNFLWAYRKSGTGFATILNGVKLPTYLCLKNPTNPEKGLLQKTVDLTAALDQMIAYNASEGALSIRLKSRATMDAGFIPEYKDTDPEKYLVIPMNAAGVPQVPGNCATETSFYKAPVGRQDIQIQSATELGCESANFTATRFNAGKCKPIIGCTDKWVWRCQPDVTDVFGAAPPAAPPPCPQAAGIPPSTCSAADAAASTDTSCDTITIKPSGAACADKTQYGILNRPGLYYPPGVTAKFFTLAGRSAVLAETNADTRLFTQSSTTILVRPSAPAITLDEGGTLILKGGAMLQMNPSATLNSGSGSVTLKGGGQLLSAGGSQLQSFSANAIYAIPAGMATNPLELRVGRSITLPAGFLIPTTPTVGAQPPYMRLPVDPPAQ